MVHAPCYALEICVLRYNLFLCLLIEVACFICFSKVKWKKHGNLIRIRKGQCSKFKHAKQWQLFLTIQKGKYFYKS